MSNNVEPNDDFELNVQRQGDAKGQQAVAKASTALMVEREPAHWLGSHIQVSRLLHTAFDVLLQVWALFSSILRTVKNAILRLPSLFLARLIGFALARPMLKTLALAFLCRYPSLESRLYKFALSRGIIFSCMTAQNSSDVPYEPSTEFSRLTPDARSIYFDLKAAIERHNKEG